MKRITVQAAICLLTASVSAQFFLKDAMFEAKRNNPYRERMDMAVSPMSALGAIDAARRAVVDQFVEDNITSQFSYGDCKCDQQTAMII